eukprot:COSAG05_NODE_885_length_6763_cov_10.115396_5_plen_66_part_00
MQLRAYPNIGIIAVNYVIFRMRRKVGLTWHAPERGLAPTKRGPLARSERQLGLVARILIHKNMHY